MKKTINIEGHANPAYTKNMEFVTYHDVGGANLFQMALHKTETGKYYLYCAAFAGIGIHILEVTDPLNPRC